MLKHRETLEYAVKLWAIADLLPCLLEASRSRDVKTVDCQFTVGWINFAGQALEESGLTGSRNTKKCEAFTEFQTERNLLNSNNFSVLLANIVHSDRAVVGVKLLYSFFLFKNVFILLVAQGGSSGSLITLSSTTSDYFPAAEAQESTFD